jgi:histidine triad (HIT) family protein
VAGLPDIITAMEDSIFTKIIKGEIPAHKVYEDDLTFAFLDIHPKHEGHLLVIPKRQVQFIWDLPDEDYQALMKTVKKIGPHLKEVLRTKFVGIQVAGDEVPHTHVHLIPFDTIAEFRAVPDPGIVADDAKLEALANSLKMGLI